MTDIYHSALKDPLKIDHELERYESKGSLVFYHDVVNGYSPLYNGVDAIYSEPSWRAGYLKFQVRAGTVGASFGVYLQGILDIVQTLKVPSYLLIGKHMVSMLQPPKVVNTKLHGYDCLLGIWNADSISEGGFNTDIIDYLADKYARILDFSCGYGNMARALRARGKTFVCSDINKKCVYYVAKEIMRYNG